MSNKFYQRLLAIAVLILVIGIIKPFPLTLINTLCLILGAVLIGLTLIIGKNRS
ncbi:hypothetical protein [Pediococcus cellicola]|uniref:Uncharacterized protein n=1 Tax=Pediococcus cellicola TaxID=319652 RepID=A0A0R2IW59_9LACO|nr:hypothetical protein [Pediococcus cellicola]KRN65885.1 hypothetical protein IV80_GL001728 [Pediococcus cellicola]GEL15699.1 hypothetical protein PCE01_15010 [Pediococcus cellicola]